MVKAWLHEGGKLEPISLTYNSERVHPSLMLVHYNNQYYLQPVEEWGRGAQGSQGSQGVRQGVNPLMVGSSNHETSSHEQLEMMKKRNGVLYKVSAHDT